jgi:hypothetical protein
MPEYNKHYVHNPEPKSDGKLDDATDLDRGRGATTSFKHGTNQQHYTSNTVCKALRFMNDMFGACVDL